MTKTHIPYLKALQIQATLTATHVLYLTAQQTLNNSHPLDVQKLLLDTSNDKKTVALIGDILSLPVPVGRLVGMGFIWVKHNIRSNPVRLGGRNIRYSKRFVLLKMLLKKRNRINLEY